MGCQSCILSSVCRRWLIVGDHELGSQIFIHHARSYIRGWMLSLDIPPSRLIDAIFLELSALDGEFHNGGWYKFGIDWEGLFEAPEEMILRHPNGAEFFRMHLRDWLYDQFGREWPAHTPTFFHPNSLSKERFRVIASAVRTIAWNDPAVRYWLVEEAANDNLQLALCGQ